MCVCKSVCMYLEELLLLFGSAFSFHESVLQLSDLRVELSSVTDQALILLIQSNDLSSQLYIPTRNSRQNLKLIILNSLN